MKHIVFDFDGTLADSMPVIISIAEDILGRTLNVDDIQRYRNMTAKEVLKDAKIPLYKVPGYLVKGRPLMLRRMGEVKLFKGLEQVLQDLYDKDYALFVVSSNSVGVINKFLKQHQLEGYFQGIYGNVGLFSKAQAIKKVLKREGFSVDDAVYVGDEVRDIEAAKKIGMPIISVTWGYNGTELLKKYKPDYLVDKPSGITKAIYG